jgi:hypothetical protein
MRTSRTEPAVTWIPTLPRPLRATREIGRTVIGKGSFDRLDMAGLGLASATSVWTLVAWLISGGTPAPTLFVLSATAVAFIGGRYGPQHGSWVTPALVAALAVILALLSPLGTYSAGPLSGPLNYANAKAAFYVVATNAAIMAAFASGMGKWRVGFLILGVAFAAVPLASDAFAASLALVIVTSAGLLGLIRGMVRPLVVILALTFLMVLAGTALVASSVARAKGGAEIVDTRRLALWRDAYEIIRDHPVTGVGPDRFDEVSPAARQDSDARWAHNGFLQLGAETGLVGATLLVSLFVWGFVRLVFAPGSPPLVAMGAAALAALGMLASVDYILHFPLVPMSAAALVGAVSVPHPPSRPNDEWKPGGLLRKTAKMALLPLGVPGRRRPGDLLILLYHRVGEGDREIDLPLPAFEAQMADLAERTSVRSLEEALTHPDGGTVVTFDDGSSDFHEHVLPILERYQVPTTLYLATGLVAGGGNGQHGGLTWSQIREAVSTGLVTVGSHTHGHTDLSNADEPSAEQEMRRSKELVQDRLGVPCRHFAYPWAVGSAAADRAARRLFETAALDAWRINRLGRVDPYRLGRTPVLRSDGPLLFRAKATGLLEGEALLYRFFRRGPWRTQ